MTSRLHRAGIAVLLLGAFVCGCSERHMVKQGNVQSEALRQLEKAETPWAIEENANIVLKDGTPENANALFVPDAVSGSLETFHLKIHRIPTSEYKQSLELHVKQNIGEPEAIASKISITEASRLAENLASAGYFQNSIRPTGRWPDAKEKPIYRIAVQTENYVSFMFIGYSASTLKQLQSLAEALDSQARKSLDVLCDGLEEELEQ